MLAGAQPSDYGDVVAAYLTAMSIIIVYHLFALQTWLESVARVTDEVAVVERETAPKDLRRADVEARLTRVRRDFPKVQMLIVGVAIAAISVLALFAARLAPLDFVFWASPTVVLALVFVASTIATWIRGEQLVADARKLLGIGS